MYRWLKLVISFSVPLSHYAANRRFTFICTHNLAQEAIQGLANGKELDYSVENARLNDGMVSFTECVQVPLYSRYKHRLLELYSNDVDKFRKAHSKLTLILITLLYILCLPGRSTEIDGLSVVGTSKEYRGVFLGSAIIITSRPMPRTPSFWKWVCCPGRRFLIGRPYRSSFCISFAISINRNFSPYFSSAGSTYLSSACFVGFPCACFPCF